MHAPPTFRQLLGLALITSLAAMVSLGITRFSYGLLLPVMRADLAWSYTLAGAMNTINALGYLLGALSMPVLLRRYSAVQLVMAGAACATAFMALTGFFTDTTALLTQRLCAGLFSAWMFAGGGLLAARLGAQLSAEHAHQSGLILGLFYGGTGWGITLSALAVPPMLQAAQQEPHAWAWAWWGLAFACLLATLVLMAKAAHLAQLTTAAQTIGATPAQFQPGAHNRAAQTIPSAWRHLRWGLAGYTCFGVGYIGYMTFVIALLREQGHSSGSITVFYALLGLAVVASSRIWAGLLQRARGGGALALLNALLSLATVLPALTTEPFWILVSGLLFGAVFLSLVASTTAMVRHNLPPAAWPAGISAFTIVFAAGQIVGPTVVGWIADGEGGLTRGLLLSSAALCLGALLAWRQQPVALVDQG